jgi:glycosyltransferase involved in cell wall biosynthesis
MLKLCFVLTSPFALNAFLRPHLERLSASYDITVCTNVHDSDFTPQLPDRVRLVPLKILRRISLWSDLKALLTLTRFIRREQFDLVYSMTPKGGLLAMAAARFAGTPCRVHCFTGQVWATQGGIGRWLLKSVDRLLVACATRLLADSASQRQYLIEEGIVDPGKIEVLLNGSVAGVDTERFHPDENARSLTRAELGINQESSCLLFVGRLKRDKGIPDLVDAYLRLIPRFADLHLLLVGPDEDGLVPLFRDIPNLHHVGYTPAVEAYMAAADVFCLPSYREGFGQVLIEAGAAGLPVVASRIYGITDAVVEGETGLLHRPGDVGDLTHALESLLQDPSLRRALGAAGRRRATGMFRGELVTAAMEEFLHGLSGAGRHD